MKQPISGYTAPPGLCPSNAWRKEKLLPLSPAGYELDTSEVRQVSKDCLVSFGGNLYSVPFVLAGREVTVKSSGRELFIYHRGELVARHDLAKGRGKMFSDPRHYEGLPRKAYPRRVEETRQLFLEQFPGAEEFIAGLVKTKGANARYHLHRVLELLELHPRERVAEALARAVSYGAFDSRAIRNTCSQKADPGEDKTWLAPPAQQQQLNLVEVAVRSLAECGAACSEIKHAAQDQYLLLRLPATAGKPGTGAPAAQGCPHAP